MLRVGPPPCQFVFSCHPRVSIRSTTANLHYGVFVICFGGKFNTVGGFAFQSSSMGAVTRAVFSSFQVFSILAAIVFGIFDAFAMFALMSFFCMTAFGLAWFVVFLYGIAQPILSNVLFNLPFMLIFALTSTARYLRLVVNIVAFSKFKPRSRAEKPRFRPEDVTVVVPTTFSSPHELFKCIRQILSCTPGHVICVTSNGKIKDVRACFAEQGLCNIRVVGVNKLNKRRQMLKAIREVATSITVFADDDVFWPVRFLDSLLAAFEDDKVGAAGPKQSIRRKSNANMWHFLGTSYLERRNFNTGSTNWIDGGISTLSGRTQAVRTSILKNDEFFDYFLNDSFLGRPLIVDDDKCLTRYIYSKGWKIALNFDDNAVLETTLEEGGKFVHQCVRWARGHFRGNFTVMINETYWRKVHMWTFYSTYMGQFQSPAALWDGFLVICLMFAMQPYGKTTRDTVYAVFAAWLVFTKLVKLVPHFRRYPKDLKYIPVSIVFSYLHGLINIYALCTLHQTIWGGKDLGDEEEGGCEDLSLPEHEKEVTMTPFGVFIMPVKSASVSPASGGSQD